MSEKQIPLAFYYSWQHVADSMIPNIMAEFKWHGVKDLVFTDHLLSRVVNELRFWSLIRRHAVLQGIDLIEAHGLLGQGNDLCCPEKVAAMV